MTVESTSPRMDYTGDGAHSTYDFTFAVFDEDDLEVTVRNTSNVESNPDYSVTLNDDRTGSITLTAGNLTSNYKLTIRNVPAATQPTSFRNQREFYADRHEDALDRVVQVLQAVQDNVDHALRFPISETTSITLPTITERASKYLIFDSSGAPTAGTAVASGTVSSTMSAFCNASTLPYARSLLGVSGATVISVKDYPYLAAGDGTTDDTAALNSAFSQTGKIVFLPDGNYKVTTNLNEPTCAMILGAGYATTRITAATGVTNVIKLGTAAVNAGFTDIRDLSIYGNATTNAIGVIFGNEQLINLQTMTNVQIRNFTGTGAIGLDIRDAVTHIFTNCYISGNTTNVKMKTGSVAGTPTTITFIGGSIRSATGIGCSIVQAYGVKFIGTVFENNTQEGCYIGGTSGYTVQNVLFQDCWWEGNCGTDTARYQMVVDGSAASTTISGVRLVGGYFNGSGVTAKSVKFTGQFVRNALYDNVITPNLSGQVKIESSAVVTVGDMPNDLPYSTVVSDTTTNTVYVENINSAWTSWTPSYTPFGAMTFGTITTTKAKYKKVGKFMSFEIKFTGTTGGTAAAGITISLPSGVQAATTGMYIPVMVIDSGSVIAGYAETAGTDGLYLRKPSAANFTLGANTGGSLVFTMEVA